MNKRKLPIIHAYTPDEMQLEQLAHWLAEYELRTEGQVEDADLFSPTSSDRAPEDLLRPFDSPFEEGQIRLFASSATPHDSRMLYIALLKQWGEEEWLVAPFSQYTTPATTGELALNRQLTWQQTLCLWNARNLSEETLQRSWVDDTLSKQEVEDALTVFQFATTGKPLSDELRARTGLPILKPDDPRIEYQKIEAQLLNQLQDVAEEQAPSNILDLSAYRQSLFNVTEEGQRIAAADGQTEYTCCARIDRNKTLLGHEHLELLCFEQEDSGLWGEWWHETERPLDTGAVYYNKQFLGNLKLQKQNAGWLLTLTPKSCTTDLSGWGLLDKSLLELIVVEK